MWKIDFCVHYLVMKEEISGTALKYSRHFTSFHQVEIRSLFKQEELMKHRSVSEHMLEALLLWSLMSWCSPVQPHPGPSELAWTQNPKFYNHSNNLFD
ncbi:hypothetical protein DV515_00006104 [Chloebia gouldiae]|uniref:Uncharacterized protein n=1 Tax=Chloebia gouldiae TaxID=44316 RepID=A0A3L8SMQ6_CHLGU|nr:hypothetical protein DV515_00006104 [Chloebia gouldiae]